MDNIQFEIKEKVNNILDLTETNKKVSFNNIVQVKTIPNNDQNKKQQVIYTELQTLQNIYGQDLEKEKINQERILADIKRQKQMEHFLKLQAMLDNIAKGKLKKFFKDNTLIKQSYIKDNKLSIENYIESEDKDCAITAFKRVALV